MQLESQEFFRPRPNIGKNGFGETDKGETMESVKRNPANQHVVCDTIAFREMGFGKEKICKTDIGTIGFGEAGFGEPRIGETAIE